MRVTVPIVTPSNTSKRLRWDDRTFDLPDVAETEAPVVVTLDPGQGGSTHQWRSWNGRLWKLFRGHDGNRVNSATPLRVGDLYHPLSPTHPEVSDLYREPDILELANRSQGIVIQDSEPMVRRRLDATISIGGSFYERSPGPVTGLWYEGGRPVAEWRAWDPFYPSERVVTFSLQDRDVLKDCLEASIGKVLLDTRRPAPVVSGDLPFEDFDQQTSVVEGAAANVMFSFRSSTLLTTGRESVQGYLDMREAYLSRWPHMKRKLTLSERNGWCFEVDQMDFPDARELWNVVMNLPAATIASIERHKQILHRIAIDRLARDPRFALEKPAVAPNEDLEALASL